MAGLYYFFCFMQRKKQYQGAVNPLSTELNRSAKHDMTVNLLCSAASKNSGKNRCCLIKIDIKLVIDVNENVHTSSGYVVVFCFDHEIYDDMPLFDYYQCQFHIYMSQILVNSRQKTFASGICFSLRVMSIFRILLLLQLSVNLLRAVSAIIIISQVLLTAANSVLMVLMPP